jgi:hypothetical protein
MVHNSNVSRWKRTLDYPLGYGIQSAKGLEFKTVILLDSFLDLHPNLQKTWRDLFLGRWSETFHIHYPEIESQMKLLYTGVTRCIEQLFFAKTKSSISGDAFVRRITTGSVKTNNLKRHSEALVTLNNVGDDVEKMPMTRDEWISSSILNAEAAEDESKTDLSISESLLNKSIYCFEQADNQDLTNTTIRFQEEAPISWR